MLSGLCARLADDVYACVLIGQVLSLGGLIVGLTVGLVILWARWR